MTLLAFRTLSLISSCFFVFGVLLALIGYVGIGFSIDAANLDDRALASTLQVVAWSLVGVSIIPEIVIDVAGISTGLFHGRYGHRKFKILSWLQTLLFAGGVITQGMAMKRPWDSYENLDGFFREKDYQVSWEALYMISSVLLTISGVLAVIASGCCCCGGACCREGSIQQKTSRILVQVSNVMFLCPSAALVFAVSIDGFCNQCYLGYFLVIIAYAIWIGCGVLWIIADAFLPEGAKQPEQQEEGQQARDDDEMSQKDDLAISY
jgi:hypothetical protein